MIEFEEAVELILKNTKTLSCAKIPVEDSIGMILKEEIISGIEMPPFNKSAVDGYALYSDDIVNVPVKLKCLGRIQAGEGFLKKVKNGECVKIMTGAPLPDKTDSVVMIEKTKVTGDYVEILQSVPKGRNVCCRAEDLKIDEPVLKQGIKISPSHTAIISAVGKKYIKAVKKPKIAVLNTGNEIVPPGVSLPKYKIYNSNGPMLSALLKSDNIPLRYLGIARDNSNELKRAVLKGLKNDILLISGGVCKGDYDLVPDILKTLGVKEIFHNISVKPGRPFYFGKKKDTLIFGIPGNPISNFLAYYLFIRPAVYKMMGYSSCSPQFRQGVIRSEFKQRPGRKHFVLIKILNHTRPFDIDIQPSHGSADINALSKADGFMIVESNITVLEKNSQVKFFSWKEI